MSDQVWIGLLAGATVFFAIGWWTTFQSSRTLRRIYQESIEFLNRRGDDDGSTSDEWTAGERQ